jgi:hypothetical protein
MLRGGRLMGERAAALLAAQLSGAGGRQHAHAVYAKQLRRYAVARHSAPVEAASWLKPHRRKGLRSAYGALAGEHPHCTHASRAPFRRLRSRPAGNGVTTRSPRISAGCGGGQTAVDFGEKGTSVCSRSVPLPFRRLRAAVVAAGKAQRHALPSTFTVASLPFHDCTTRPCARQAPGAALTSYRASDILYLLGRCGPRGRRVRATPRRGDAFGMEAGMKAIRAVAVVKPVFSMLVIRVCF